MQTGRNASSSSSRNASPFKDISNYKTPQSSWHVPDCRFPSPVPLYFTASSKTPVPSYSSAYTLSALRRRPFVTTSKSTTIRRLKALEIEHSQSLRKSQTRRQQSLKCISKALTAWLNFMFENPSACGCSTVVHPHKRHKAAPLIVDDACSSRVPLSQPSLQDVCSVNDLKERMSAHLSPENQILVLNIMCQVTKCIDEGRLRMKAHCPVVTDVRLKDKAMNTLMSYNLIWLRIGLHMVLGGDSLLLSEGGNAHEDQLFLAAVIEKHFFCHSGLAKSFAYNKKVEGLYMPGYYEALGNVILKRFLLLALVLDMAKCQSSLPLMYGIDAKDGGSPLLFDPLFHIKSSRQFICEFLSEVMHGEGDLLAHLGTIGYKVTYQQTPLSEYIFTITDLSKDLHDGVRLCRAVQLLLGSSSLLSKLVVPSDSRKKNLANCGVAMQYLNEASVPLFDDDGVLIVADDIVNEDMELALSLLWNIFVHLQVPLLIDKTSLGDEISRMKGVDVYPPTAKTISVVDMLMEWIQDAQFGGGPFVSAYVNTTAHQNFTFAQKVTALLGNFPEVLEMNDIPENGRACNERSAGILAVFLSSQLIGRKNMDQILTCKIVGWNYQSFQSVSSQNPGALGGTDEHCKKDGSASIIQTHFRGWSEHKKYANMKKAILLLQSYVRGYIAQSRYTLMIMLSRAAVSVQSHWRGYKMHQFFLSQKKAALRIQRNIRCLKCQKTFTQYQLAAINVQKFVRGQLARNKLLGSSSCRSGRYFSHLLGQSTELKIFLSSVMKLQRWWKKILLDKSREKSTIIIQSYFRCWAAQKESYRVKNFIILIQSHWRCWLARRDFLFLRETVMRIQKGLRCLKWRKLFLHYRAAVVVIQRFTRARIANKRLLGISSPQHGGNLDYVHRAIETKELLHSVLSLQRWWRQQWYKSRTRFAVIIQSHVRSWLARREACRWTRQIILIQSHMRGCLARKESNRQLHDLRSAPNVDDSMDDMNPLVDAVQELLNHRGISGVLNTCATLDMATKHSQKCCETLVAAGAVEIILKLIQSVNRSAPHQAILKCSLSTLRNLVKHPHLAKVLISANGSVKTVFLALLRNRETFFVAAELLKELFTMKEGMEAAKRHPLLIKRLHNHVEFLEKKAAMKRSACISIASKESIDRRLKEASELLLLILNN